MIVLFDVVVGEIDGVKFLWFGDFIKGVELVFFDFQDDQIASSGKWSWLDEFDLIFVEVDVFELWAEVEVVLFDEADFVVGGFDFFEALTTIGKLLQAIVADE